MTLTKFNQGVKGKENQEEEKEKLKTGFTGKPSDKFKKVKAADPFSGAKKHKTNFGYVYASGGIPIRINHGSVRNQIAFDRQPEGNHLFFLA